MSDARAEFAAWVDAWLPADYERRWEAYRADRAFRKRWQADAFDAGWLVPGWPVGLGGRELRPLEAMAVRVEAAQRAVPKLVSVQTVGVVAPALRAHGTEAQRDRHLVPALRGDEDWCLGMSEPGSGSDFASIRTTAVQRGDVFVVNGAKLWTTQADESRWCTLYCRTDPAAPRHRGISCLLLDMERPGVTVRRIRMADDGIDQFCEVYLDDVEVPVEALLGPLHGGWDVSMSALEEERDMIWIMNWVEIERGLRRVASAVAGAEAPGEDLLVELGRLATASEALRRTGEHVVAAGAAGEPSPAFHALKLAGSELVQRVWDLALHAAGPEGRADGTLLFEELESLGATIYGGTSEIQRNIIGERVLGLPREPRPGPA